jgi:alpha-aminoadipic semialdehyde synthase
VDHLPAELPKEASEHFGEKLLPFVEKVAKSNFSLPFEDQNDYDEEMKRSVITCHG